MTDSTYEARSAAADIDHQTCSFPGAHPPGHPIDLKFHVMLEGANDWEDLTETEIIDRIGLDDQGRLKGGFTHTSFFDFWYEDVDPLPSVE